MYQYDAIDQRIVEERAAQFRGQVTRRLAGEITEDEFKPLRLQNGLYMQLHAYMLRVAIPYGLLSSKQLRMLARIARVYDKGYGHLSTRQNIQYNWPKLEDVPSILDDLASVQMHAIQTSGNCIRNTTADAYAGVARDEIEDPRPWCELIRQWSTFHPEFAFLPRKFKIAVTGAPGDDRAAVRFHDIGLRIVAGPEGEHGFEVIVGGGLGRTPFVGKVVRGFLPKQYLLSYLEAILRVYNVHGRRDNKYKARIKVLVDALGVEEFSRLVEEEWELIRDTSIDVTEQELARVKAFFIPAHYETLPSADSKLAAMKLGKNRDFGLWVGNNVTPHKVDGYGIVTISVKAPGKPPGDITDTQMEAVADLADRFSQSRLVVTHMQNLVFPDVKVSDLESLWRELVKLDLATANAGKLTDMICCPGLDYCALANATSIPIAEELGRHFDDMDYLSDIGEVSLKMSGCINACGHHHIGNIGILGIDKRGEEFYQLMLGGSPGNDASLGKILGPAFAKHEIVAAVGRVLARYLELRESSDERFIDAFRRVGAEPFKEAAYADHQG
ncbi:MAG: nitrite/sulfite reductase [Polyangiaceae bacterium]